MYNVKFYKSRAEGIVCSATSCPHYEIYERADGGVATVTLFKDFFSKEGVEYHIYGGPGPNDWDSCFIENAAGKTIHHEKAKGGGTQAFAA